MYIYPVSNALLEFHHSKLSHPTDSHHDANHHNRRNGSRSVQFTPCASCYATLIMRTTNTAGLGIYRAALADPSIQRITLLTRRALPSWAELPPDATERTDVILHSDFKSYPTDLAKRLAEHDALIWALGKSSVGMSKEAYTELTYDYTMSAARALKDAGAGTPEKPFRIVWISGELANPEGTGQMWANVKVRSDTDDSTITSGTHHVHATGPGRTRAS